MMCSSVPGGVGGSSGGASEQQQQLTIVPPGFRFHPTDEELLYYYLKKKVSYEVIDLDVIRDVDLNKIEPWDLKEKCSIGSGPQNEWYFFSHKDKKYPTGTRTNRATNAGFWKATGRDKAIHDHQTNSSSSSSSNNRIGMRKTLVFYTGRAPHGQKTDWIMHEYRLIENDHQNFVHSSDQLHYQLQEDGWVVCRVFKKRTHQRGFQHEVDTDHQQHPLYHHQVKFDHMNIHVDCPSNVVAQSLHHHQQQLGQDGARDNNSNFHQHHQYHDFSNLIDSNMHLPHLLSEEQQRSSTVLPPVSLLQQVISMNNIDIESSHNLLKLASSSNINNNNNVNICGGSSTVNGINDHKKDDNNNNSCRFNGDWSFLDKLLASHRHQSFGSSDQHQN